MKKKILLVGPWVSGHIKNWLGNNEHPDFEYRILTCHPYKSDLGYSVKSGFVINQFTSFILFPLFLLYELLIFRPDLTHVHFGSSYGLLSSWIPGKKILSLWGTDVNGKMSKYRFFFKICRACYNRYDVINSPAQHITTKLINGGIKKSKIVTFQYGIDINKLEFYRKKFPKKSNLSNKVVFSSIRNWDELYQVKELIEIWDEVTPDNYILNIFGRSISGNIEKEIKDLIRNSCRKVRLMGFLDQEQFYRNLCDSDAFISIPTMDGLPLSVLECMCLNLYPIVSDIPANHEVLGNDHDIFLPISLTKIDLKLAIYKYDNLDDEKLERSLFNNRSYVDKHGNINLNRNRMFDIYRYLINV